MPREIRHSKVETQEKPEKHSKSKATKFEISKLSSADGANIILINELGTSVCCLLVMKQKKMKNKLTTLPL